MKVVLDTKVTVTPQAFSTIIDDDLVILNPETGIYFATERVGTFIWSCIISVRTVGSICDMVVGEFDIDQKSCEEDTISFIVQLIENGLAEIAED